MYLISPSDTERYIFFLFCQKSKMGRRAGQCNNGHVFSFTWGKLKIACFVHSVTVCNATWRPCSNNSTSVLLAFCKLSVRG